MPRPRGYDVVVAVAACEARQGARVEQNLSYAAV